MARRWNVDPRPVTSISPYATFQDNPILLVDPMGDTTNIRNLSGQLLSVIPDSYSNEDHFFSEEEWYGTNPMEGDYSSTKAADGTAHRARRQSRFFIDAETRADALKRHEASKDDGKEHFFLLYYTKNDRRLRFHRYETETEEDASIKLSPILSDLKKYIAEQDASNEADKQIIVGWSHSHLIASLEYRIKETENDWRYKDKYTMEDAKVDGTLNRPSVSDRSSVFRTYGLIGTSGYHGTGGNLSILISPAGYSIYTTGCKCGIEYQKRLKTRERNHTVYSYKTGEIIHKDK